MGLKQSATLNYFIKALGTFIELPKEQIEIGAEYSRLQEG